MLKLIPEKYRAFTINLIGVLIVFAALPILTKIYEYPLSEKQYDGQLLITNWIYFGWKRWVALSALFFLAIFLSWFRPLKWNEIGKLSRYLFWTVLIIQTYTIAMMEYNHYHAEWFLADRILHFLLAGVVIWNPYFLPVYILQLVLLTNQLEVPDVVDYDRTHKSLILPILWSFWVFTVLYKNSFEKLRWTSFVLIFLSILSAWFMDAGIGKIKINWAEENNLYNMLAASTDAGWLHFLSSDTLKTLGEFVRENHKLLQYGGLVVEVLFPLLLLWHRKIAAFCLVGFAFFHLLVYTLSGIFFWQWMVMELIVLLVILYDKKYAQKLFTKSNLAIYYLLLLINPFLIKITDLAWLDCGFINSYTFYLINDEGKAKRLDSSFFSPYDVGFAKNRFYFARNEKHLTGTLGQCLDENVLKMVGNWHSKSDTSNLVNLENYRTKKGLQSYNEDKAERFRYFLKTFTRDKLKNDPKWISNIDMPIHIQQGENQQNFDFENAQKLKMVYAEKVALPHLHYFIVKKDSILLDL